MKHCKHCKIELPRNKIGYICTVCKNGIDRYGLTRLQQISILESQNRTCKLCKKHLNLFEGRKGGCIDHSHSKLKIRGILCHECNTMIGYIENKKILSKDIQDYLNSVI